LLTRSFDVIIVSVNGWPLLLWATWCVHRDGSLLGARRWIQLSNQSQLAK